MISRVLVGSKMVEPWPRPRDTVLITLFTSEITTLPEAESLGPGSLAARAGAVDAAGGARGWWSPAQLDIGLHIPEPAGGASQLAKGLKRFCGAAKASHVGITNGSSDRSGMNHLSAAPACRGHACV